MNNPNSSDLLSALNALPDQQVWGVTVGKGTGSAVLIHIGQPVKRKVPLTNSKLPSKLITHEGSLMILIQNAALRLDAPTVLFAAIGVIIPIPAK